MRRRAAAILALALTAWLPAAAARAALFGAGGLDPAFCRQPQVRQTVVYIDDTLMIDGQTDWAHRLDTKLRATLAPGERVTVVRLSPGGGAGQAGSGQSSELWSGCWPAYSAAEQARFAAQTYLFEQNPLAGVADQQKYFLHDFGAALTQVYLAAKRPADSVRTTAADAPAKQIIRALASDEGRFAASQVTIRAIIYSDMAENSDLGTVFRHGAAATSEHAAAQSSEHAAAASLEHAAPPSGLGQRLGTYLRGGVFYAFGVGSDISDDPGLPETARGFWRAAFGSLAAALAGMGADLNVPNILPVVARRYPVTLSLDGQTLDGRIALLADQDGTLVDSWLGISRLGIAMLEGSIRCTAGRPGCRLEATTSVGIATSAASEQVSLSGPERGPLSGRLGVRAATGLSFPLQAAAP